MVDDEGVTSDGKLNKKLLKSKNLAFLTTDARQVFIQLRQTFTKIPIFNYFNLEYHI